MRRVVPMMCFVFVMLLCVPLSLAQTTQGQLNGRVADASGAVIPGAQIEVTNPATGVKVELVANEAGQYEVYVVAYPEPQGKHQVSSGGGHMPTWSPGGDELFYIRQDDWVMQVSVSLESGFEAQQPRELFGFPYQGSNFIRTYDVAPDGQFLMVERGTGPRSQSDASPRIIFNWLSELERLVPSR